MRLSQVMICMTKNLLLEDVCLGSLKCNQNIIKTSPRITIKYSNNNNKHKLTIKINSNQIKHNRLDIIYYFPL